MASRIAGVGKVTVSLRRSIVSKISPPRRCMLLIWNFSYYSAGEASLAIFSEVSRQLMRDKPIFWRSFSEGISAS